MKIKESRRMCICCRGSEVRQVLIPLVLVESRVLIAAGYVVGRKAHIHNKKECILKLSEKVLNYAFRLRVGLDVHMITELKSRLCSIKKDKVFVE